MIAEGEAMALTLPNPEDLDVFSHDSTDTYTDTQKSQALQQAGDLLYLATKVTDDPTDAQPLRIVKWGLLDMAWKLLVNTDNKTEIFSPYQGENIGSYSYSKLGGYYARELAKGGLTGVEWFDLAVSVLSGDDDAIIFTQSENVFAQPQELYEKYTQKGDHHHHDSYGW